MTGPWLGDGPDEGQHAAPSGWGPSPSALPPGAAFLLAGRRCRLPLLRRRRAAGQPSLRRWIRRR